MALEYRIARARATLDIDISTVLDLNEMSDVLAKAAAADLNDYFQIVIGEREQPVDEIEAYRVHVAVQYADGRTFENLKLDISFADPWIGTPLALTAPFLLEFAGIPQTIVRAIPAEQHLAEKIHAYTKLYGSHRSSRVKDLIDIVLLLHSGIDDDQLQAIIPVVFASRHTHEIPNGLPPPPSQWRVPYGKLALGLPVPPDLDGAYQLAADELAQVLSEICP